MKNENRLIAEFMEFQKTEIGWYDHNEVIPPISNTYDGNTFDDDELSFHISWNWLIPVIEKCFIGEAELHAKEFKVYIQPIYDGLCSTDKLETYEAVVKFIKWKNDQLDYTKISHTKEGLPQTKN